MMPDNAATRSESDSGIWRRLVRLHFVRPRPGAGSLVVGFGALVVAAGPLLLSLAYAAAFWSTRANAARYVKDAQELYQVTGVGVLLGGIGCLVLIVPVLGRVLRPWVLLPGVLVTAVSLFNAIVPGPPVS